MTAYSTITVRLLAAAALAASALTLTACGDDSKSAQALGPVEIDRSTSCSLDGMLLADYPGPKAQILYADQTKPAFFCDTMELINQLQAGEQVRAIKGAYVQDMGKADWNQPQGHWIDAKTALYVVGSKRHGSMGPTIASFAQEEDAARFVQEHGGKVMKFGEIKPGMADLSGGALHDTRM
ncbi:nitrous oxide reductase accessory protein NosL [Diaphorobacter caeni]|uniref:nitrous oxide reductase accessory protein NosL n=1 Tax=Diaphorobacter caeni TaxID=2784387 RepID=UPI00188FF0B3|nr:nitrous oxide reductase accessory protein NosL [Diaphorobacter caeni]MBF5007043.1 nitrous oxide reductase accessory protein NosL [Diaphorobacter caeni]